MSLTTALRDCRHRYHPVVHALLIGTGFKTMAYAMSMPFLAVYLAQRTELSVAAIGLWIGLGSLSAMFGGFFGGALSDRVGRRRVMLGSMYLMPLIFTGYALTAEPWLLLLILLLGGFGSSFFEPAAKALMADLTPQELRPRLFSLRYMALNIGFALGPLLGVWFGLSGGSAPFWISAALYLAYAVTLQILLTRHGIRSIQSSDDAARITIRSAAHAVLRDRALLLLMLGGVFTVIVHGNNSAPFSQYLVGRFDEGLRWFSLTLLVNTLTVVLFQYPLRRFADSRSPLQMVALGVSLYFVAEIGFAFAASGWVFLFWMFIFTLGEILVMPSEYILLDRITPPDKRGTYFGAQSFTHFGDFLGPWLAGSLLLHTGSHSMFFTLALIALASLLFFRLGTRAHQRAQKNWQASA